MKKWTEVSAFTGNKILDEDMPTSASGHGNIAGLGVGPQGEPGIDPKKKKKRHTLIDRNGKIDGRTKAYREHRRKLESARIKRLEQKKNNKFTESVTNRMKSFGFEEYLVDLDEVLGKDADMGDYIDDFKKSDSPQFKGKSEKKRKEMAIAAYMSKQREETEVDEACWAGYKQVGMKKKGDKQVPNCVPEESKLNELSKKLLKRYSDKASKDIDKRFAAAKTEKDREKLTKRLRGYAKGTLKYRDKKEYVNYPYGPLDTMRPMADLGDIPNYYGTKLNAQRKKKKVNRDA